MTRVTRGSIAIKRRTKVSLFTSGYRGAHSRTISQQRRKWFRLNSPLFNRGGLEYRYRCSKSDDTNDANDNKDIADFEKDILELQSREARILNEIIDDLILYRNFYISLSIQICKKKSLKPSLSGFDEVDLLDIVHIEMPLFLKNVFERLRRELIEPDNVGNQDVKNIQKNSVLNLDQVNQVSFENKRRLDPYFLQVLDDIYLKIEDLIVEVIVERIADLTSFYYDFDLKYVRTSFESRIFDEIIKDPQRFIVEVENNDIETYEEMTINLVSFHILKEKENISRQIKSIVWNRAGLQNFDLEGKEIDLEGEGKEIQNILIKKVLEEIIDSFHSYIQKIEYSLDRSGENQSLLLDKVTFLNLQNFVRGVENRIYNEFLNTILKNGDINQDFLRNIQKKGLHLDESLFYFDDVEDLYQKIEAILVPKIINHILYYWNLWHLENKRLIVNSPILDFIRTIFWHLDKKIL